MDQKQNQCKDCAITLEFERGYYGNCDSNPLARLTLEDISYKKHSEFKLLAKTAVKGDQHD